jgi:hypothetical protein
VAKPPDGVERNRTFATPALQGGPAGRLTDVESRAGGSSKQSRRVALAVVATYHEAELAGLIEHVAEAIERYRAGEIDVHDVDEVIHRYHKATQELWKFCFGGGSGRYAESVAASLEHLTAEDDRPDWWAKAERRRG